MKNLTKPNIVRPLPISLNGTLADSNALSSNPLDSLVNMSDSASILSLSNLPSTQQTSQNSFLGKKFILINSHAVGIDS